MITVKALIEITATKFDNRSIKKKIIRKYDNDETVVTAKLVTQLYKLISNEFYMKYNNNDRNFSIGIKIYYISCKQNEDS